MKRFSLPILSAVLLLFATPVAAPQYTHHFPTPPEPADPQTDKEPPPTLTKRIDMEQVQREADDLARTAQSIPSDVANIRKGMLPKDVVEKLKQIEKLSKHLRGELNP